MKKRTHAKENIVTLKLNNVLIVEHTITQKFSVIRLLNVISVQSLIIIQKNFRCQKRKLYASIVKIIIFSWLNSVWSEKKLKKIKIVKAIIFLFYFERFSTSTKNLFFSLLNTLFLFDNNSERDKSFKNQKFKNSKFKNIELINFIIITTIFITIFTTFMIIISISFINYSEKPQIKKVQLVIWSTKSTRNVSFDWRLSSSISEKKHQSVILSTENVSFDWQLNLISQIREKNKKTFRNFSDQIIQQIQSIINFMLSQITSISLSRKRKIMISIINENISTSHRKIANKRTIKTIEKIIKNIRIANAKAKRIKTKKIEWIFEKDNAMINAQINNDISEIIFEIATQNSNQNSLASINASQKRFEIDVLFIEKIIFNFNEWNNEANQETNQSSMNQMISYMIFEILTNVNITKSFSENSSNSICQTQDSNAIIID